MATTEQSTRQRILIAATAVFGQAGFRAATIRQIAQRAAANVAAVNYYFRDKQGLYTAVIEELLASGLRRFPSDGSLDGSAPPEKRLEQFVRSFFQRMVGPLEASATAGEQGRLIARELAEPSPALDRLLNRYIRPQKERLMAIVAELAQTSPQDPAVTLCTLSIIGQCLYYAYARPLVERLAPDLLGRPVGIEALARHVTHFSLAGIRHYRPASAATCQEEPL